MISARDVIEIMICVAALVVMLFMAGLLP